MHRTQDVRLTPRLERDATPSAHSLDRMTALEDTGFLGRLRFHGTGDRMTPVMRT